MTAPSQPLPIQPTPARAAVRAAPVGAPPAPASAVIASTEPSPGSPQTPGPLSPDHLRAVTAARLRLKKVVRASNVARFGGWTLGFFAVVTIAMGLPSDFVAIALGVALSVVAFNEFRGGAQLKQLNPAGGKLLGYNQLALGAITVAYAIDQLVTSANSNALTDALNSTGGPEAAEQLNQTVGDLGALSKLLSFTVYGTLAVLGALVPGLTAWYYFSRGNLLRGVLRDTPAWIVDVLRA